MQHDPAKLLEDIRGSASFIIGLTQQITLAEYETDPVVSAAVERHFIIIGEAIQRLARLDAAIASRLGNFPQIIAFRNVVVHGYDTVEHAIVWGIISNELPNLLRQSESLLRALE